ncbi:MAG: fluoride efflux transporter CrcB [Marinilabiliales bacterium]|nr:MAG: fluoride efflux transporter CrcB [Marinilabiliales bacterium]
MIYKLLAVAFGGSIGAVARYLVFLGVGKYYTGVFPWASLTVNLTGAFVIGILWGLFDSIYVSPAMRTFLFIGILGSFTTFSTFTFDLLNLYRDGEVKMFIAYLLSSNILGIALVFLGFYIFKLI